MTGPTENEEDRKIAPRVGGSKGFRGFIRQELMPQVKKRYRTTGETAIVGESLAGLFIVETFLVEPDLFDTYIAFDPSLWWNDGKLVQDAAKYFKKFPDTKKTLYFVTSEEKEMQRIALRFQDILEMASPPSVRWNYDRMPQEKHSSIYHPAALKAFRELFPVK